LERLSFKIDQALSQNTFNIELDLKSK